MEIFQGDHAMELVSNLEPLKEDLIRAVKVEDFSSQYGFYSQPATSYLARNIIESSVYPHYGDHPQAFVTREYGKWWMESPSGKIFKSEYGERGSGRKLDFIDVQFECEFIPTKLILYETFNPGSVVGIWALVSHDEQTTWEPIYDCSYQKPTMAISTSRILEIPIFNFSDFTSLIRIEMEQTDNWYYSELDTVKALGFRREGASGGDRKREERDDGTEGAVVSSSLTVLGPCYIDLLPPELVERIARLVTLRDRLQLSATSKKYRSIICHSSLFGSLNLRPFWFNINSRVLDVLGNNFGAGFKELDLSWCGLYMGREWLSSLSNLFSTLQKKPIRLTRLRLNNSRCLLSTLSLILQSFSLEELSLEQTKIYSSLEENQKRIKSDYFQDLVSFFPESLTALNIAESPVGTNSLVSLLKRTRRLTHLNICNCKGIDLDIVLPKISQQIPDLRTLQAWRLRITPNGLKGLAGWKNLEEIDLGWSLNQGGEDNAQAFAEVVERNPNLRVLDLSSFRHLGKTGLETVARCCPLLEQIGLVGIGSVDSDTIKILLESCARLQHVDVSFCAIVSSEFRQLVETFPQCQICACNMVTNGDQE